MSEIELLRWERIPVYQNKIFTDADSARRCPVGDMRLVQDRRSGRVFNADFDPTRVLYDASYQNEQAHSAAFQHHLDHVERIVDQYFRDLDILEVGCGKGVFLERLRAKGHRATGIDPAYEGDADYILAREFAPGLGVRGDAIVLRHVLEHIPDPVAFLQLLVDANGGAGLVYIEVPCVEWIFDHRAWFDIFYEHVNYFRLEDFARMFGRVLAQGHLFAGQYLYVVADLSSLRDPGDASLGEIATVMAPSDLMADIDRCASRIVPGSEHAVWGAAAKGTMYALHMARRRAPLDLAIDINPAKQGGFLAGSGLPVFSPQEALARMGPEPTIHVMNSNYLDEIRATGGPSATYWAVDEMAGDSATGGQSAR